MPRLSPGGIGPGNPAVAVENIGEDSGGGGAEGDGAVVAAVDSGIPVRMGDATGGVDCDKVSKPGKLERLAILFIAFVAHFARSK